MVSQKKTRAARWEKKAKTAEKKTHNQTVQLEEVLRSLQFKTTKLNCSVSQKNKQEQLLQAMHKRKNCPKEGKVQTKRVCGTRNPKFNSPRKTEKLHSFSIRETLTGKKQHITHQNCTGSCNRDKKRKRGKCITLTKGNRLPI